MDWPDRLNRFVEALRANRSPEPGLAQTPEELDEMRLAAKLAGSRSEFLEPDPEFLAALRDRLGARESPSERRLTRSGLLRVAGLLVAGLAGGVGLDRLWDRELTPPPSAATLATAGGAWYRVAELADLRTNAAMAVDVGGVPAFVIRQGDSATALSRVCTHMGCLLRFDGAAGDFQCPCHGAVFDLSGKPDPWYTQAPLPPLPALQVQVVKGAVYVRSA
ncbi:MAG: ubiquinol-cytochrome c reductase iron-sulfur subunit [Chloroflexota bacterium]